MNRKLIRPTLADVKNREPNSTNERSERSERNDRYSDGGGASRGGGGGGAPRGGGSSSHGGTRPPQRDSGDRNASSAAAAQGRKRIPPSETNAEIFYYKKQMDAHTQMVLVLNDGEEIIGTIEWYDRAALKINRKGEPNILLLKHNIKYIFKAEDRDGSDGDEDGLTDGDEDDQDD